MGSRLRRAGVSGWHGGQVFPNGDTTGPAAAGYTQLTPHPSQGIPATGPYPPWVTVLGDGSLLVEGVAFTGPMSCFASNIKFRGCSWSASGSWALNLRASSNVTLQYCQISAPDQTIGNHLSYGINAGSGFITVDHCNIFWWEQGLNFSCSNVAITNNWIHDEVYAPGDHTENIYLAGNQSNILIAGNHLSLGLTQTAVIAMFQDAGAPFTYDNVQITGNLITGGGYALDLGNYAATITNMVVAANQFSTRFYPNGGVFGVKEKTPTFGQGGNVWTGNTWYDGASAGQLV